MQGSDANRLEQPLCRWYKGRLKQIKEEEVWGKPSIDFLTLAFIQDTWRKLLNAQLAHTSDLLAALNEPAETVVVLAQAEDGQWLHQGNCLEYWDHHKIGWILTSASISFFPGVGRREKCVQGLGRGWGYWVGRINIMEEMRSSRKCMNSFPDSTHSWKHFFF